MSAEEKKRLIKLLAKAHIATRATLDEVDLEMPVFTDSGWRIRDIIGHIATWDQETAKSLRAYQEGSEYSIPDLDEEETEYNERAVVEQKKLSTQQILAEWEQAHGELKKAVQEIPEDQFPGDMLYPWGDERGSIATLVEYMIEHAVEHQDEIIKALQESGKG
ncbi:MAG: maleylpyruvate isomerase N-terminal domain-containing protein [Anaerolineales bacterium]|nr:maleylpyruvate isomerase N-terminal domain-containing protein [Chloroflexota bacterium]MBL6980046.1 maleylpyruvate isomerase N-terminal domain-containing protein [Anaerolineales bacterium]